MIKILIVEDEKPIADLLDMSLTAAGYHCDWVDNGVDAAVAGVTLWGRGRAATDCGGA